TGPLARRILGRPLVVFRDGRGAVHALSARCPHRGADLGRGSVVDGCVQCPFHGWRFDGAGRCVRIPSQPEGLKIASQARVASFPLLERDGVLWIWMGSDGTMPSAPPPAAEAPSARYARIFFAAHLCAAPFLAVLENFFDQAHVPFIHASFGRNQDTLVARQQIVADTDGRGLRAEADPNCPWPTKAKLPGGIVGVLARLFLGLRTPVTQHTRFDVEAGAQTYLEYPNGTFDRFIAHLTPADDAHTRLFVESLRTRAPHALGSWIQRRAIGRIFAEGERETSLILDSDPTEVTPPVSVEADRLGLAARRLYERWEGRMATHATAAMKNTAPMSA